MNVAQQQRAMSGQLGIEAGMGMDQGNLARAMLEVMKAVQYVEKRGRNDFHNYNYAMESDVVAAIRKGMIDNDLVLLPRAYFTNGGSPNVVDENGLTHVSVEFTLIHAPSGERANISFPGSGSDKNRNGVGDKGVYKALTGAYKYALLKVFLVETGDDPERHERDEEEITAPPQRPPLPPRTPPDEPDRDPNEDDPRTDRERREDDRDPDDDDRSRERDSRDDGEGPAIKGMTAAEARELIVKLKDPVTPIFREPAMGDEPGHKWEIVEETFRQFVALHESYGSLKSFYEENIRILSIMEREAPKRKRRVDGYFNAQKKYLAYRDKDQADMKGKH
jgi:hypothetical protein